MRLFFLKKRVYFNGLYCMEGIMKFSRKNGLNIFVLASLVTVIGCDKLMSKPKQSTQVKPAEISSPTTPINVPDKTVVKVNDAIPKNVLVRVGDWALTADEFKGRLAGVKKVMPDFDEKAPGAKEMLLDEMIRQQLLVYEARQQKMELSKELQGAVKDYENTLLVQELARQLTDGIKATELDAHNYYNANPDVFVTPVEKQLREIIVPTEAEAKEILVQILQGADFVQIAKEKSKGKTASIGGDRGFFAKAPNEDMQKEIESLKKGDVSRVFKGPEGFYIVRIDDVRGGEKKSFDSVKEDLIKGLTMQKQQQALLEKMSEVAKKINVQVNSELLKE